MLPHYTQKPQMQQSSKVILPNITTTDQIDPLHQFGGNGFTYPMLKSAIDALVADTDGASDILSPLHDHRSFAETGDQQEIDELKDKIDQYEYTNKNNETTHQVDLLRYAQLRKDKKEYEREFNIRKSAANKIMDWYTRVCTGNAANTVLNVKNTVTVPTKRPLALEEQMRTNHFPPGQAAGANTFYRNQIEELKPFDSVQGLQLHLLRINIALNKMTEIITVVTDHHEKQTAHIEAAIVYQNARVVRFQQPAHLDQQAEQMARLEVASHQRQLQELNARTNSDKTELPTPQFLANNTLGRFVLGDSTLDRIYQKYFDRVMTPSGEYTWANHLDFFSTLISQIHILQTTSTANNKRDFATMSASHSAMSASTYDANEEDGEVEHAMAARYSRKASIGDTRTHKRICFHHAISGCTQKNCRFHHEGHAKAHAELSGLLDSYLDVSQKLTDANANNRDLASDVRHLTDENNDLRRALDTNGPGSASGATSSKSPPPQRSSSSRDRRSGGQGSRSRSRSPSHESQRSYHSTESSNRHNHHAGDRRRSGGYYGGRSTPGADRN